MIYKEFKGLQLSALGMGTMRLPVIDGKDDQIDDHDGIQDQLHGKSSFVLCSQGTLSTAFRHIPSWNIRTCARMFRRNAGDSVPCE